MASKLTIRAKLLGAGVTVSLLLCIILAITLYFFYRLDQGFLEIVDTSGLGVDKSQSAETTIAGVNQELDALTARMGVISESINRSNAFLQITARKIKDLSDRLNEVTGTVDVVYYELEDGDAKDELELVADDIGDLQEIMKREALIGLDRSVIDLKGSTADILEINRNVERLTQDLKHSNTLSNDVSQINAGIQQLSRGFQTEIQANRNILALVIVLLAVLSLIFGLLLARGISRPLGKAVELLQEVSRGNLHVQSDLPDGDDEIGRMSASLRQMREKLIQVIEREIYPIVTVAKDGNLSGRIPLEDKDGFYRDLSNSINQLVDINESVISDTNRILNAMASGDLSQRIPTLYKGAFNELKQNAHLTQDKLSQVIEGDIQRLVSAALCGDLSQRIELDDKEGFFRTLSTKVNELMEVNEGVIRETSDTLEGIAQGDLTRFIDNAYEGLFGQLAGNTNACIVKLQDIVAQIREAAEVVSAVSGEISRGNADMSQRTESQASSLEETSVSLDELISTVSQNSQHAQQADALARGAWRTAEAGGAVVSQAVDAMREISDSSRKIGDIIGLIDAIAFQTNLLALNASVEAARAGQQGRGFAVVAQEVRNLAQRSANAARQIKALIKDSYVKVASGTDSVNRSGATLQEIVQGVKAVSDIITEIAQASKEQNEGIAQVNTAISQIDQSTQSNANLADNVLSISENLNSQARTLMQLMSFFRLQNDRDHS